MTLLESWKDSLKLCTFAYIKLFMSRAFQTMREVIQILMVPWFLIPFTVFVCLDVFHWVASGAIKIESGLTVVWAFLCFMIAARVSNEIKDFAYFKKNIKRMLWLLLIGILIFFFIGILSTFLISYIIKGNMHINIGAGLALILPAFFDLALFFYLDHKEAGEVALKRALIMSWYNYPLWIVYAGSLYLIERALLFLVPMPFYLVGEFLLPPIQEVPNVAYLSEAILMGSAGLISLFVRLFFMLLVICLIVNLYYKRLHDQPELYQ